MKLFILVILTMDKIKIRTLLKYYWKQNYNAIAAVRKVWEVEGVVTSRIAPWWSQNFKNGENELQNQPRSGRYVTLNSAMLRKSVESNPSTGTRRKSAELGVAQRAVVRHLKAVGKVNKYCREVTHDLTENQAIRHVETCRKLLENPRDYCFIHQIVLQMKNMSTSAILKK